MSALLGMTLGAGIAAVAWSAPGPAVSSTVITQETAPSSTPATPAPLPTTARAIEPIGFAEPVNGPAGLSVTVLPPEKVKGGVRLTIALANTTDNPITVNTGELGPHDLRFNGAEVPMTMTPTTKKLMPEEGYTYQCVIRLPTMDMGQLALDMGSVTITGQAAGD